MEVSEELKKELSNAFAAYAWILQAASHCCDVPSKFEIFKGIESEEVNRRLKILHDFYISL